MHTVSKKASLFCALCLCLIFAFEAQATLIVDTGAAATDTSGVALGQIQSLAGQFTISNSYTVSAVEGWFGASYDGTLTAAIYSDVGTGIPDSELFSQQFLLDTPSSSPPLQNIMNDWDGAYGLNWSLSAGTYWLVFKATSVDTGEGWMPGSAGTLDGIGAPNPLATYAFLVASPFGTGAWKSHPGMGLGMRISAVPIPATVWLFGSGLLGLVGMARYKKTA